MTKVEHRSFPEAANGSPTSDAEVILFGAGCDPETARFVARQLSQQGFEITRPTPAAPTPAPVAQGEPVATNPIVSKLRRLCGILDDLGAHEDSRNLFAAVTALEAAPAPAAPRSADLPGRGYALGARVRKVSGSSWQGHVVGYYSTTLTPDGICVESEREPGSVQIYPAKALALLTPPSSAGPDMRAAGGEGWLPIETAVRDSRSVDLGFWVQMGTEPAERVWIVTSGWYEAAPADRCWYSSLTDEPVVPTHWRPASPPPAAAQDDAQGGGWS